MKSFIFNCVISILMVWIHLVTGENKKCSSESDCSYSECCVISGSVYRAVGKCKKLSEIGASCQSPRDRLEFDGGKYVGSCPCQIGLICKNSTYTKLNTLHPICVRRSASLKRKIPHIFYKREVSEDLKKSISDDNDELDFLHDNLLNDMRDSISPVEDTDLSINLGPMWNKNPAEQFTEEKNEKPLLNEVKKQPKQSNKNAPTETSYNVDSKGIELNENVKTLIQGMLSAISKQPANEFSYELEKPVQNENSFLSLIGSKDNLRDTSKLVDKTFSRNDVTLDATDILKVLKNVMSLKSKANDETDTAGDLKPYEKMEDEEIFKPDGKTDDEDVKPDESLDYNNNFKDDENIYLQSNSENGQNSNEIYWNRQSYRRTKSPLEIEWDASFVENKAYKDYNQLSNENEGVSKELTTPTIHLFSNKSEQKIHFLQDMETTNNRKVSSKHNSEEELSQENDSIIQLHYSKDGQDDNNGYKYSNDPNADYMDDFP